MIALPGRTKRTAIALVLLFLSSRVVFYAIGIRFDASPLGTFWQFLDPTLLKHRLAESLLNLHAQPPLFNLFLGIVLKIAPVHYAFVFHAIYVLIGITILLGSFQLLLAVGVSERWAFRISLLFAISPASIVFENWLFYDYPLAAIFVLMALFLHRFASNGKLRDGVLFFSLLTVAVLMRSLFHVVWVFAVVGLLYYALRDNRRTLLKAAIVPLLIICTFSLRNYIEFGSLSGSTWLGQHLSRVTTEEVPEADRAKLVEEGKLSKVALIPVFSDLRAYPRNLWANITTGVPALDAPVKESGAPNFNHLAYIQISKIYQQDAIYIAMHYPRVLATSIIKSCFFYLRAPNEFYMLRAQNEKMATYETFFRRVVYGEVRDYPDHATKQFDPNFDEHVLESTPIVMFFLLPLSILFGISRIVKARRSKQTMSAADLTIAFIVMNVVYVSVIANIFEMGENNRIRFMMDPLFLVLGALMAQRALAYVQFLATKRPQVAAIVNWTRSLEPNFARQFRVF